MTDQPVDELAALGLAARILLAYEDNDADQVARLVNADPNAAMNATIMLAGALAGQMYGDQVRQSLGAIVTTADLDAIGREVTG